MAGTSTSRVRRDLVVREHLVATWRPVTGVRRRIAGMAALQAAPPRPRARRRALAVAGVTALSTVLLAAPASAVEPVAPGEQSDVMTIGQAVLVFVGIPLAIAAVIYLLVLAPSWTRSGRTDVGDGLTAEPFVLGGDAASDRAAIASAEPELDATSESTGGTSASW
jgi:hypothetical protein